MTRQTKLAAILSMTVLLAAGASTVSFAADSGWQEENGAWVYLDKDGNRVCDTWKKSGSQFFYLNEDGEMPADALIDYDGEKYYVDANGARVTNKWVAIPNDDHSWDEDITTIYYCFGSTGKAYRDARKNIEGKIYFFDDEARMLSGWHTSDKGDLYYLGNEDEGWARTGWQYLEPEEGGDESYDGEQWFYFNPSNGKAYRDSKKYINGHHYTFNTDGVMQDSWALGTPGAPDRLNITGTDSNASYKAGVGNLQTGWVYTYGPDDPDEDGDKHWYYLDSEGVPFNYQGKDSRPNYREGIYCVAQKVKAGSMELEPQKQNVAAKVINNKTYLFDQNGKMLTGIYMVLTVRCTGGSGGMLGNGIIMAENGRLTPVNAIYYFNDAEGATLGQMMTGKYTFKVDGMDFHYYFQKSGKAYTLTIVDGVLYGAWGFRATEGNYRDGAPYTLVSIDEPLIVSEKGNNNKHTNCVFVVNTAGRSKKSGTVTIDGYKYTIKNYEVQGEPVPVS